MDVSSRNRGSSSKGYSRGGSSSRTLQGLEWIGLNGLSWYNTHQNNKHHL